MEMADLERVAASAILFITAIHVTAISKDRWSVIGNRPLERALRQDVRFCRKNPSGEDFLIYVSKERCARTRNARLPP